ncbi:MAG: hypothetical protein APF84_00090 [Gracilibacter sp. BRH_c7a]|nr:MAG: hypothetical protein APF84_00090 [Gracilibacter sp. BRH_c7a]
MSSASLGKWISLLYRYGQIYISKELEPYSIGRGQFLFLLTLYSQEGLSQEELAQTLNIDKGTTARAVEKLEKNGYLYRKPRIQNLRTNEVFLTQKAKDFEPLLYSILKKWTDILSTGMSEYEIEKTFIILEKMNENATNYITKYR